MSGSVFISIPVWPPSDADDLYFRTHGKVDFDDESDTPMVKVHVFDSDRVLVRGLDGMYAGQSIELPDRRRCRVLYRHHSHSRPPRMRCGSLRDGTYPKTDL